MSVKVINESNNKLYKINFTNRSKSIPEDIMESLVFDFYMSIDSDTDACVPWDADISINDNKVIITGGAGSNGVGRCTVEIPISDFNDCYYLTAFGLSTEVMSALVKLGYHIE